MCSMPESLLLGAIADDFTGAADLASMLSTGGVMTALCFGPGAVAKVEDDYQAIVVALKSRSTPAKDACSMSLDALEALRRAGAQQIYFKYCSTFDSSAEGNIGPVTEALMKALDVPFTVAVPALPVNGRTQYLGYLFIGDQLLSETHMRDHPIHPMEDPNLVRHLQAQVHGRVGLIPYPTVREGAASIRRAGRQLAQEGTSVALVDVLADQDLLEIAEAVVDQALVTGGSGLGGALAEVWGRKGMVHAHDASHVEDAGGGVLILSGSCSTVSLDQIAEIGQNFGEGAVIDVLHLLDDFSGEVDRLYGLLRKSLRGNRWALVYSSADAVQRGKVGTAAMEKGFSRDTVSREIEAAHKKLASRAVADGLLRHVVVAGGETSGAVAEALDLAALEVADVLDPGVPVLRPIDGRDLTVTFKSGNFGSPDFFSKALRRLGGLS